MISFDEGGTEEFFHGFLRNGEKKLPISYRSYPLGISMFNWSSQWVDFHKLLAMIDDGTFLAPKSEFSKAHHQFF